MALSALDLLYGTPVEEEQNLDTPFFGESNDVQILNDDTGSDSSSDPLDFLYGGEPVIPGTREVQPSFSITDEMPIEDTSNGVDPEMLYSAAKGEPEGMRLLENFVRGLKTGGHTIGQGVFKIAGLIDSILPDEMQAEEGVWTPEFAKEVLSEINLTQEEPTAENVASIIAFSLGNMLPEVAVAAGAGGLALKGATLLRPSIGRIAQTMVRAGGTIAAGGALHGAEGAGQFAIMEGINIGFSPASRVVRMGITGGVMAGLAALDGASEEAIWAAGIMGATFGGLRKPEARFGNATETKATHFAAKGTAKEIAKSIKPEELTSSDILRSADMQPSRDLARLWLGKEKSRNLKNLTDAQLETRLAQHLQLEGLEPGKARGFSQQIMKVGVKHDKAFRAMKREIDTLAKDAEMPSDGAWIHADGSKSNATKAELAALKELEVSIKTKAEETLAFNKKVKINRLLSGAKEFWFGSRKGLVGEGRRLETLTSEEVANLRAGQYSTTDRAAIKIEQAMKYLDPDNSLKAKDWIEIEKLSQSDLALEIHGKYVAKLEKIKGHKLTTAEIESSPITPKQLRTSSLISKAYRREGVKGPYVQKILKATDRYFEMFEAEKIELLNSGIISKKAFDSMSDRRYMPLEVLAKFEKDLNLASDKTYVEAIVGGNPINSIGDAVVFAKANTNPQLLMHNFFNKMEYIKAKHETGAALGKLAKEGNSLVLDSKPLTQIKTKLGIKPKDAYTEFSYVKNSKREKVWVSKEVADSLQATEMESAMFIKSFLPLASLTNSIRGSAISLNPPFGLLSIPRDIAFWNLTNTRVKSFLRPQRIGSVLETFKDVRDGGEFIKAYGESRGSFYTYGRDAIKFEPLEKVRGKINPKAAATRHIKGAMDKLNVLNNYFELALRVHNAKTNVELIAKDWGYKSLKELKRDPAKWKEAWDIGVGETNRALNFRRSGTVGGVINSFIPFFNPAMQAIDGLLVAGVKDPKVMAGKAAQLVGAVVALNAVNYLTNPDGYEQLSTRQRLNNWNFMLPGMIRDSKGNKIYPHIKLKQENSPMTSALVALAHAASDKMFGVIREEEFNAGSFPKAVMDSIPLWGESAPIVKALETYLRESEDIARVTRDTPEYWKTIGEVFGLHPEAARKAFRDIRASNPFSTLFGIAMEGTSEEANASSVKFISEMPVAKQFLRFTYPNIYKDMKTIHEGRSKIWKLYGEQQLDFESALLKGEKDIPTIRRELSGMKISARYKADMIRDIIGLDTARKKRARLVERFPKLDDLIPSDITWAMYGQADVETRARWFFDMWVDAEPTDQRALMSAAASYPGFFSRRGKGFTAEFGKLKRDWMLSRGDK